MTIFEAYNNTKKELDAASVPDFVFEAKQIIKHVTGYSSTEILMRYSQQLTVFQQNNLTAIVKQRIARYPLQYIFGEWGFYGRSFYVGPGVLVPRADTETVIDLCRTYLDERKNADILDLCAGSGCIGITLACLYPESAVVMVEKYSEAVVYLEKNIIRNTAEKVQVITGDIFEAAGTDRKYDLIVSNPPYIPADEMDTISPETHFEPESALYGGEDGLMFYRAIINGYLKALKSGGMLCFEVGAGEADAVYALLQDAGLGDIGIRDDLNGIRRAVFGTTESIIY